MAKNDTWCPLNRDAFQENQGETRKVYVEDSLDRRRRKGELPSPVGGGLTDRSRFTRGAELMLGDLDFGSFSRFVVGLDSFLTGGDAVIGVKDGA